MIGARAQNALGNPLLLRRALDKGVRVIAAHFASEGEGLDERGARRECFDLLLGMMAEPRWEKLLFADISAIITFRRVAKLVELLTHPNLFGRCVYGSDYPVPCLGGRIVGTRPQAVALLHGGGFAPQLVALGLVSAAEAKALDEVFQYNPLLFDLVLKLTARHPVSGVRLPASVFGAHALLPLGGGIGGGGGA